MKHLRIKDQKGEFLRDANWLVVTEISADDILNLAKAAVKEGVVAGGGTTLVKVADRLRKHFKKSDLPKDVRTGIETVINALSAPIICIADNAGVSGAVVAETVRKNKSDTFGYDALEDKYVDMIESGIIDPTKVTRSALENAGSVASTLLTTEVLVCDIDEKINTKDPNAVPNAYGMYN